jgi:regulator of sirC expression with transglutaminase-like and TPR domain
VLALDRLAAECQPTFEGVLHQFQHHLTGNTADYGDPRNSYLHEVLHRGLGIPITLSVCAIELGRRVGVPIRGVGLPGHFMVESGGVFADPFHLGRIYCADELEPAWRRMTGLRDPLDRNMLAPVSQRGILLRMLNNLKATFVAMDDPVPLRILATLRGAFPELAQERAEYARWLRHWN